MLFFLAVRADVCSDDGVCFPGQGMSLMQVHRAVMDVASMLETLMKAGGDGLLKGPTPKFAVLVTRHGSLAPMFFECPICFAREIWVRDFSISETALKSPRSIQGGLGD